MEAAASSPSKSSSARPALMIPGPIEFSDGVLTALGEQSLSHTSPMLIELFGGALERLRHVFQAASSAQPFIVSGSGTLGWDMIAANLLEQGDKALVVNTGVFCDWFGECLETYGAQVSHVHAPVGDCPSIENVEKALRESSYKLVTLTHVDTSTGVLTDVHAYAAAIRRIAPDAIIVVDGVCATAGEETRMEEWDLDVVLTASQKAMGTPPGLSIVMASERALKVHASRKSRVASYYANWAKWQPIMKAYEARTPSYFATPPTNLIKALRVSLDEMLATDKDPKKAMENRFKAHKDSAQVVRKAIKELGLSVIPVREELQSNAITAIRFPAGVTGPQLIPKIKAHGAEVAGGIHPQIKAEYFRIGHMGVSATDSNREDITRTLRAVKAALQECGYTHSN